MANIRISDAIKDLLEVLPQRIKDKIYSSLDFSDMIEVILDLGKSPEIRFEKKVFYIEDEIVTQDDIDHITSRVGKFTSDNRAGIERTLHRISAIRNRTGKIVGLTCRIGRVAYGTIDIINDIIRSNKSILFLGPPGIGKTTKLREAARVLSDELKKRVIVVDTSNEIAGDGDIPHAGIGKARRMQVPSPERQHAVMIEAVENHMPEVIIIDEIGTEAEASAARTIAERGVVLIGTAHGLSLENIISNPTLCDLLGGIQTVILGDEEAKRRKTQKAILERKAAPTFDVLIEIRERDVMAIYTDVAAAVDKFLRGKLPSPEVRIRKPDGIIEIQKETVEETPEIIQKEEHDENLEKVIKKLKIFPYGVNKRRLERSINSLGIEAEVLDSIENADLIVTTRIKTAADEQILKIAQSRLIPIHVLKSNTSTHVIKFLKKYFRTGDFVANREDESITEAQNAAEEVMKTGKAMDLTSQNAYVRRLQHNAIADYKLNAESIGDEPNRRIRIYPPKR